jgi:hypothetical protein
MQLALLVLGISVAVGIGLAGYWLLNTEPAKIRKALKWIALIGVAAVIVAVVARGNPSFLWTAGLFLIPMIMRWRRIGQYFRNAAKTAAGPSAGQSSSVRTVYLEMNLDHDTGAMSGSVLGGQFAGRQLADMPLDDLLDLLTECQDDPQSNQLLENFIDRVHGDEWRSGDNSERGSSQGPGPMGGTMSRAQAQEILGVAGGASEQEIRDAHRRLMLANHPDRGGSTFLAAQINQAKEVLLGT